jgi:competence protein ComEC
MRNFRRTTLITVFCLAILAGLGLSRRLNLGIGLAPLLLAAACLLILRPKKLFGLFLVAVLGLGLGLWRGDQYMDKYNAIHNLALQKVTIMATATNDSVYGNKSQIQFNGNHIKLLSPYQADLAGSFKLSGFGEHMIYKGDRVEVTGKVFPSRGSNQATIAYAQLERLSAGSSPFDDLGRHFSAGMQSALPEPLASFAMGLLIGQRNTLPAGITAALTAVGLVHIVAVSGYNLTILTRAAGRLKLGSKYQKLVLSLLLIVGFVLLTGFSASIIRAAIVSALSLWAWFYGRRIKPWVIISFAAAVTAFWNPFYVWGDLSWYLSFLAFFGVLVIAPLISARFFKKQPKLLTLVVLETLSAEIMTLPLIMMTFGQLSIIALIANALVVPLVPLAMLLAAVAGAAGAVIPQFAGWLALPARLLLTYMLDIVHLLANLPSALVHRSISTAYMLAIYATVAAVLLVVYHKLPESKNLEAGKVAQITP